MVSVRWLVLWPCSRPALISASVWIFDVPRCLQSAYSDSFLTFNIPYLLPDAVKRPKNSSHTPHSLLVPDLHPPLIHTTYQHLFSFEWKAPFIVNTFLVILSHFFSSSFAHLVCSMPNQHWQCAGVNRYNLILTIQCWFQHFSFSLLFYALEFFFSSPFRLLNPPQ